MLRDLAVFLFFVMRALAQEPAANAAPATPTVVLEGRVVDLRGEGVPLATVWVTTREEPDAQLARNIADGEGWFRIGKVPPREHWTLRATSDGRSIGEAETSSADAPTVVRVHDAATLRGVLRNRAGQPVAGAIVRFFSRTRVVQGGGPGGESDVAAIVRSFSRTRVVCDTGNAAATDAHGAFTVAKVPLGPTHLCAVVPGEGLFTLATLVTADGEVTLAPVIGSRTSIAITLAGLPTDAAARVRVSLRPKNGSTQFPPPWERPAVTADGRCLLADLPDDDYVVRLESPTHMFVPREQTVKETRGPHDLKFTAVDRERVAGSWRAVVRDAAGQPLSGVRLAIATWGGLPVSEATSAADGVLTFQLREPAGTEVVVRSLDDRWTLDQQKTTPMRGVYDRCLLDEHECTVELSRPLDLRAVPATSVQGRVRLADGRPAAFVVVELEAYTGNAFLEWTTFEKVTTDREGNYRFRCLHHLGPQARIKVESTVGAGASDPFSMSEAGAKVVVPEWKLSQPAILEGVVSGPTGKPAPGVRILLSDWDSARGLPRCLRVVEVITDRLGRYRFVGVPPGEARLQVCANDRGTGDGVDPVEVEAGKRYTVDLRVRTQ